MIDGVPSSATSVGRSSPSRRPALANLIVSAAFMTGGAVLLFVVAVVAAEAAELLLLLLVKEGDFLMLATCVTWLSSLLLGAAATGLLSRFARLFAGAWAVVVVVVVVAVTSLTAAAAAALVAADALAGALRARETGA